ncbi:hypothetical protein [Methylibium petroleiphilum]|uniref:Uncharacterized protein n=1 Tax=Methylibium petroleiphilum (strain ATCC BAA-1232 / LMG 22953 / PM1) TaxID=420662 RepID=A2SMZ9_METPP|nr:hypothetical protein [Methylibium petroleiphilum]ABM96938.1 hypothetical protein Mpe_B0160 [Methylibium petroleiphilum PM1]
MQHHIPALSGRLAILSQDSPLFDVRALQLETAEEVRAALNSDATARRIMAKACQPAAGELVGVRLNLNIIKSTGVRVHSIHRGTTHGGHARGKGFYRGEVINYSQVVTLRHAWFNVHQAGREQIAEGGNKGPMASVDGEFVVPMGRVSFDGVEIRFNPRDVHLFVDLENFAVQYAEEVTLAGHRAYARGLIVYHDANSAPARAGNTPSIAMFRAPARHSEPVTRYQPATDLAAVA